MRGIGKLLKVQVDRIADALGVHPLLVAFIVVALIIWGDYLVIGRRREQTRFSHVKTAREAAAYTLVLGTVLFLTYFLFVA